MKRRIPSIEEFANESQMNEGFIIDANKSNYEDYTLLFSSIDESVAETAILRVPVKNPTIADIKKNVAIFLKELDNIEKLFNEKNIKKIKLENV